MERRVVSVFLCTAAAVTLGSFLDWCTLDSFHRTCMQSLTASLVVEKVNWKTSPAILAKRSLRSTNDVLVARQHSWIGLSVRIGKLQVEEA